MSMYNGQRNVVEMFTCRQLHQYIETVWNFYFIIFYYILTIYINFCVFFLIQLCTISFLLEYCAHIC